MSKLHLSLCILSFGVPSNSVPNQILSHAAAKGEIVLLSLFLLTRCQSAFRALHKHNKEKKSDEGPR